MNEPRESEGGSGGHGSIRRGRHRSVLLVVAAKVVIVALVIALPSGLAISLGVAHAALLVVVLVALAVVLLLRRRRR